MCKATGRGVALLDMHRERHASALEGSDFMSSLLAMMGLISLNFDLD